MGSRPADPRVERDMRSIHLVDVEFAENLRLRLDLAGEPIVVPQGEPSFRGSLRSQIRLPAVFRGLAENALAGSQPRVVARLDSRARVRKPDTSPALR